MRLWSGACTSIDAADESLAVLDRSPYFDTVSSVNEIESAVARLSSKELAAFRNWFAEYDAKMWDQQFAADIAAGHLDSLADEALRDLDEGRCTDL